MLRGGNMWFRPAIFIWLVFAQSFFKFHKNSDIRKLKPWSFRLWKNDFCRLYNERAIALQSSITIFLRHPVYVCICLLSLTNSFVDKEKNNKSKSSQKVIHSLKWSCMHSFTLQWHNYKPLYVLIGMSISIKGQWTNVFTRILAY